MNINLLIFFALPLATIILAIVFIVPILIIIGGIIVWQVRRRKK
mgnify:CR=1 FL=1